MVHPSQGSCPHRELHRWPQQGCPHGVHPRISAHRSPPPPSWPPLPMPKRCLLHLRFLILPSSSQSSCSCCCCSSSSVCHLYSSSSPQLLRIDGLAQSSFTYWLNASSSHLLFPEWRRLGRHFFLPPPLAPISLAAAAAVRPPCTLDPQAPWKIYMVAQLIQSVPTAAFTMVQMSSSSSSCSSLHFFSSLSSALPLPLTQGGACQPRHPTQRLAYECPCAGTRSCTNPSPGVLRGTLGDAVQ